MRRRGTPGVASPWRVALILAWLAAWPPGPGAAAARMHEVPAQVAVQIYARPAGDSLGLLVRVPLEALRDLDLPLTGPGYLVLDQLGSRLVDGVRVWITDYLALYEDGVALPEERIEAVRLSLPSDRSFRSWDTALAHIRGPGLPPDTRILPDQALLDAYLTVPVSRASARFTMVPELAHLGMSTVSVIHFLHPDGTERVFQYRGNPGLVRLDPRWYQAVLTFMREGFLHILQGWDHLLFLLCLILPFRRVRPLFPVVTAFTVAHSITLVGAALGLTPSTLWFPPLVEALIALSILWMALENLVGAGLQRRWQLAFAFGLVHGFGFSFVLQESLQFAGGHLVASLLAFNLGVELGQLAVLAVAVPALTLLYRRIRPRVGRIVLSALVAHQAWHWMTDRGAAVLAYDPALPALDVGLGAALLRWTAVALVAVAAAWSLSDLYGRLGWDRAGRDGQQTGPVPSVTHSFSGDPPEPSTAKQ